MSGKINKSYEASEKDLWLYSIGNFSNNLIFMFVALYIMYFYTNILGLSAVAAGTIFMVARLVDAFTDPLMGMIVDHTNTKKFGKYRPYIMFGAPFLGVSFIMMFVNPGFSGGAKLVYAYAAYIVYSLAWTCVQIPQLALPIILSNDFAKRTRVQAIFQSFGAVASMVVTSWALPMLEKFGGMDSPEAWNMVCMIFAVLATILFILSSMSVRRLDVYNPNADKKKGENAPKITFKERISVITKNRALLCVLLAYGTDMFASQISSSVRIYFFKYNMDGRTDLISYIGYAGTVIAFAMILFIQPFVRKLGKRIGITIMETLSIFASLLLLFAAPGKNVMLVMTSFILSTLLFSITNMLSRSAVFDAANYAQVKTGIDGNALVSSTFTFVNKCAQAFSAFFAGSILTSTGYRADLARQSDGTLQAILYLMTLVPIAAYICSLIGMYFYPLDKKGEKDLQEKMKQIRADELEINI